jgi:Ca2+-binding EF-hand superfamily protein
MRKQFNEPSLRPQKSSEKLGDSMELVQLSDVQQAQIKEIFDLFDTDGGGSIDCREKDAAMFALGFQPTFSRPGVHHDSGLQEASDNRAEELEEPAQTITLAEFTTLMKGEQVVLNPVDAIWAAFAELSGGDPATSVLGSVTVEALKRACKTYDVKLSEDELHQLIDELDVDGDGCVDKDEFMRLMRLAAWF